MNESMGLTNDLQGVLSALPRLRIGVVGDFCLDFYQFVDMSASEISVETGLETLPVREVRYSLGGAGNVVNNLCAMGAQGVRCYGVVGDDPHGELLSRLLKEAGADPDGMLIQAEGWLTQTYTKVMVGEVENPRIDWGNFNRLADDLETRLIQVIARETNELDLLIINQQLVHGIQTPGLRNTLVEIVSRSSSPRCITDSRDYCDEFSGTIRKLNDEEAARLCARVSAPGSPRSAPGDAEDACGMAEQLFERWKVPVLLTRGERGCIIRDETGIDEVPGIVAGGRIDTVGAGDSMLAGTAAALAAGLPLRRAAVLGNLVAGVTVRKLHQTGTATPEEIGELARNADYRFRPELALMPERARYLEGTRIEIVSGPPTGRRFAHAIFDNDGTLSTLRQGWEEVMEPVMVRSILGPFAATADERRRRQVDERVREFIDRTTGVQTLLQMHGLVEMVREHGFVAEEEILSPEGYKEIYNRELMKQVEERIRQVESGELAAEDFLIKGAAELVSALVERGIRVYLASGTDHEDVLREANVLGYGRLFGDAVYGSVGDIHNDPKKIIIGKILETIGRQEGNSIVTFGDGPVEIRETGKRGGYSVGIASNELRRFGLNPAKRKRLIEAGADLIVSDFTQLERLTKLLLAE